jgi:hypothetical protein
MSRSCRRSSPRSAKPSEPSRLLTRALRQAQAASQAQGNDKLRAMTSSGRTQPAQPWPPMILCRHSKPVTRQARSISKIVTVCARIPCHCVWRAAIRVREMLINSAPRGGLIDVTSRSWQHQSTWAECWTGPTKTRPCRRSSTLHRRLAGPHGTPQPGAFRGLRHPDRRRTGQQQALRSGRSPRRTRREALVRSVSVSYPDPPSA